MCGIVGYTGKNEALPVILQGLKILEYRGYDSAGVAISSEKLSVVKSEGKIEKLENRLSNGEKLLGKCGIGHTRWATHGEPSERNAHPQISKSLLLVHNGIIENYLDLRERLKESGYHFKSETDTEVAAHLIDYYYQKTKSELEAIALASEEMRGSYAFCIIFKNDINSIWAVRSGSPLLCALSEGDAYFASDVTALLPHSKTYYEPDENVIVYANGKCIKFYDFNKNEIACEQKTINWNVKETGKNGYSHYMLKEINEQPLVLKNTVNAYIKNALPEFDFPVIDSVGEKIDAIKIIACGTAMHAGLIGKSVIEKLTGIPVSVEIASEFRYSEPIINDNTLVIAVSQSGETADTIAAVRLAGSLGLPTLAIVNAEGSTLSRLADHTLYTKAGPEISVASTKAYTVQCAILYLIAFKLSLVKRKMGAELCKELCEYLENTVCDGIDKVIRMGGKIKRTASRLSEYKDVFFIGRGVDSSVCMEGSLKLKEISYIHSEAYPAGELKHGTISLIDANVPVIALITAKKTAEKTLSNVLETKTRGAFIFAVISEEVKSILGEAADEIIVLPKTDELFAPFLAAVAFQLLAYYTATARGNDVDNPKNLAKSVTVE